MSRERAIAPSAVANEVSSRLITSKPGSSMMRRAVDMYVRRLSRAGGISASASSAVINASKRSSWA
ncbi:MAG: hypothetical protein AAF844_04470 [Pseudomonadota bacterium]